MNTLSQHEVWEEILFGNVDEYRRIVDSFPDTCEFLAAPNVKPHASNVVEFILNGRVEELLRGALRPSEGYAVYGFREYIKGELMNLIGDCPDELVEEVVDVIRDDLDEPDELPVIWPDE